MSPLLTIALLLLGPPSAAARAPKACEDLKSEITKKIAANSVKTYSLEIVAKDKQVDGPVVGFCDGGTKKIVYHRVSTPPQTPPIAASKP
jgi:hypothetical protein